MGRELRERVSLMMPETIVFEEQQSFTLCTHREGTGVVEPCHSVLGRSSLSSGPGHQGLSHLATPPNSLSPVPVEPLLRAILANGDGDRRAHHHRRRPPHPQACLKRGEMRQRLQDCLEFPPWRVGMKTEAGNWAGAGLGGLQGETSWLLTGELPALTMNALTTQLLTQVGSGCTSVPQRSRESR